MARVANGEVTRQVAELLAHRHPPAKAGVAGPVEAHTWLRSPVADILDRRRAVRRFTDDPLTIRQLAAIVACAYDAERTLWPATTGHLDGITVVAATPMVDGLAPGMHVVGHRDSLVPDRIVPLRAGDSVLPELRDHYAAAPTLLFLCADLGRACNGDGCGYGGPLVRCGSIGYAMWLKAIDEGLAGCLYGAAHPSVTDTVRQYQARLRHLFTMAVGTAHPLGGRT